MTIKCVWHEHPIQPRSVLTDAEAHCFVCLDSVSGYNYRCPDCNFFLHISCLKLPLQSLHPLHHHHPLTLLHNPPPTADAPQLLCSECTNPCSGFTYHCSACSFSLHLYCASKQRPFRLDVHRHPLTFFPSPFGGHESFRCSLCADLGLGFCLACKACEFVIHVECSAFPATVNSTRHRHLLSLTSVRSIDDGSGEFYCDIVCEGEVDPKSCVYYCAECKYMAHLGCLASAPKPQIKFSYQDVDVHVWSTPETVQGGIHGRIQKITQPDDDDDDDGITKMRRRFSELRILGKAQSNQIGEGSEIRSRQEGITEHLADPINQIKHFSHEHPLTLGIDHNQNTFSCSACFDKISSSLAYVCTQCNYFLHRWCAELPEKIKHPIHPEHPLTLLSRERSNTSFCQCNACDETCDSFTFAFNCDRCSFNLHPMCASMPTTLRTEIHRHPLILRRKSPYSVRCKSCGVESRTGAVFECRDCDLDLDFKCAMLPDRIRHRCHVHPLSLKFVPFEDDSEEFYCDACEELRDPTHWVYHCTDCEYSAHMSCVVSELLGGPSLRGLLEYDHHENLLRLITKSSSDPS